MESIQKKHDRYQVGVQKLCERTLQFHLDRVLTEDSGKDDSERANLRTQKSRLLRHLRDAMDAILKINCSIGDYGSIYEPKWEMLVKIQDKLGVKHSYGELTNEQRIQIDQLNEQARVMYRDFRSKFIADMDSIVQDIFTPQRVYRFVSGMFPIGGFGYEDKEYRIEVATILLEASAKYLIQQIPENYRDLLESDMRKAIQIAHIIAKERGISVYQEEMGI